MAISIAALLGGDPPGEERPDTTRHGQVPRRMKAATLDSIFAALGRPQGEIVLNPNLGSEGLAGRFNTKTKKLELNPNFGDEDLSRTLAHELAHQATNQGNPSSDIKSVMTAFDDEFSSLPWEERQRLLNAEYGHTGLQFDSTDVEAVTQMGNRHRFYNELLAETVEEAFDISRRADSANPNQTSQRITNAMEDYPGVLQAFNFFMRAFQGMQPAEEE